MDRRSGRNGHHYGRCTLTVVTNLIVGYADDGKAVRLVVVVQLHGSSGATSSRLFMRGGWRHQRGGGGSFSAPLAFDSSRSRGALAKSRVTRVTPILGLGATTVGSTPTTTHCSPPDQVRPCPRSKRYPFLLLPHIALLIVIFAVHLIFVILPPMVMAWVLFHKQPYHIKKYGMDC